MRTARQTSKHLGGALLALCLTSCFYPGYGRGRLPQSQYSEARPAPGSTPAIEREIARARPHLVGIAMMRASNESVLATQSEYDRQIVALQSALQFQVARPVIVARVERELAALAADPQLRATSRVAARSAATLQPYLRGDPYTAHELEAEQASVQQAAAASEAEREVLVDEIAERIRRRSGGSQPQIKLQVQQAVARAQVKLTLGDEGGLRKRAAAHAGGPMKPVLDGMGTVNLDRLPTLYRAGYVGDPTEVTRLLRAELVRTQNVLALEPWPHAAQGQRGKLVYSVQSGFMLDSVLSLAARHREHVETTQLAFDTLLFWRTRNAEVERRVSAALAEQRTPQASEARTRVIAVRRSIAAKELQRANGVALLAQDQTELAQLKRDEQAATARLDELAALGRTMDKPFALQGAVAQLRQALPPGRALLSYVDYREVRDDNLEDPSQWVRQYGAFVLSRESLRFFPLGAAAEIERALDEYLQAIGSRADLAHKRERARALYQRVLLPLEPALESVRALVVVPDGMLQLVPLEALHDGTSWLAERALVSYAVSERQLAGEYTPRVASGAPLVVVGGPYAQAPKPLTRGQLLTPEHFPALAGIAAEAERVVALVPGAELLSDGRASDGFLQRQQPPRLLHVAAHGVYLPLASAGSAGDRGLVLKQTTRPSAAAAPALPATAPALTSTDDAETMSKSALVLAPGSGARSDGFLTAYEVASADLWGTELVVLSACETGRGETDRVRGMQGLRKAFFTAGAGSLVMSLWSVDDRATAELMAAFYGELAQGAPRVEALQRASAAVRAKYPDPYYWAPFVLLGESGALGVPGQARASAAAGEDDESRFRRAMQAKRAQHTALRMGTAHWNLHADRDEAVDAYLSRAQSAGRPLVLTLLGRKSTLSLHVRSFSGAGRYLVGAGFGAGVAAVADPRTVDITTIHRGSLAQAQAGQLEVVSDSPEQGLRARFSFTFADGQRIAGELDLESGLADVPAFMR